VRDKLDELLDIYFTEDGLGLSQIESMFDYRSGMDKRDVLTVFRKSGAMSKEDLQRHYLKTKLGTLLQPKEGDAYLNDLSEK
jgi:hypothetical protein